MKKLIKQPVGPSSVLVSDAWKIAEKRWVLKKKRLRGDQKLFCTERVESPGSGLQVSWYPAIQALDLMWNVEPIPYESNTLE